MEQREFNWRTPVIAIDFDGVLCDDRHPEIGEPNWTIIHEAISLQKVGVCLILWTSRTGTDLEAAVEACKKWGLEFDYINENPPFRIELFGGSDPRKIGADEYWDDRAVYVGTEKQGGWRRIHNISTNRMPISVGLEKARQFVNEVLIPEIDYMRRICEAAQDANLYRGLVSILFECREYMELFMAELSEPPSVHSWFREGYRAATENAAHWFTGFLEETGIVKEEHHDGEMQ